jgi:hypothetical protein
MVFVSADVEVTGLPVAESNLAPPSAWVGWLHALGEVGKKQQHRLRSFWPDRQRDWQPYTHCLHFYCCQEDFFPSSLV